MAQISIEELTQLADDFLRKNYGMALKIPIKRNNRLRRAMGRFVRDYNTDGNYIDIAGFMFDYASREVITDTLRHECVHYALYRREEPNSDGHPHFEAELRKYGVSSTNTCRIGPYTLYSCVKCGKRHKAKGRRLLAEYPFRVTRCCRAEIRVDGEIIYDGTEAV